MTKDDTSPATKADIKSLMDSIGRLYDANEKWKDQIIDHFQIVAEDIRHDLKGANHDEIQSLKNTKDDHERRLQTLEVRPV